jgi:RNA polymerase sigma-70 factor (ECF subfamily)
MNDLIDKTLVEDLRNGSEEAFTVFFTKYFNRICQFAITYVKEEAVAKNIVQDAFVKLWENRYNINENSTIFSFLLTLTKNGCLNYIKHQQIVNNFKKRVEDKHKLFELNYNALQQLDVEHIDYIQLLQLLEEAVSSLPPQCQQVFRLSRYDNLTNNEISEKLQITNKAVEANITRALKILRVKLKDYLLLLLLFKIC